MKTATEIINDSFYNFKEQRYVSILTRAGSIVKVSEQPIRNDDEVIFMEHIGNQVFEVRNNTCECCGHIKQYAIHKGIC